MEYTAPIITAIVGLFTGILGTQVVQRLLTAGSEREGTAQGAIIELAREALRGWREESKAVVQLVTWAEDHDKSVGLYYRDLQERAKMQGDRLDTMTERVDTLIRILAEKPKRGQSQPLR